MTGLLVVSLLVLAIPAGIVLFAVHATENERRVCKSSGVRRSIVAGAFGLAALVGAFLIVRIPGPDYPTAILLLLGLPAALIAAILASIGYSAIVFPSKGMAVLAGGAIALSTSAGVAAVFSAFLGAKFWCGSRHAVFRFCCSSDTRRHRDACFGCCDWCYENNPGIRALRDNVGSPVKVEFCEQSPVAYVIGGVRYGI